MVDKLNNNFDIDAILKSGVEEWLEDILAKKYPHVTSLRFADANIENIRRHVELAIRTGKLGPYTLHDYISLTRCAVRVDGVRFDNIWQVIQRGKQTKKLTLDERKAEARKLAEAVALRETWMGLVVEDARELTGGRSAFFKPIKTPKELSLWAGPQKDHRRKKIIVHTAEGVPIGEFDSQTDVADFLDCQTSQITRYFRRGAETIKGYRLYRA